MSSSTISYATAADLVIYHDARRIGDLISADDVRVTAAAVPTNAVVLAMLKRASGEVEMACQVGGKYTPDDLNGLDGVAKEALVGLVCDLARWHIEKRKTPSAKRADVPGTEEAYGVLTALELGALVFPTDNAVDASQGIEVVEEEAAYPYQQDNNTRYGDTVSRARRMFGQRLRGLR